MGDDALIGGVMEPSEGLDEPGEQRVASRRHIEAAQARAYLHRDWARAWGDVRLVARYQAEIRRNEAALAALDAIAAATEATDQAQP